MNRSEILTIIKGHNSVIYLRKLTRNNLYLGLVKVNAYVKFDQIPLIRLQDIERKRKFDKTEGHNPFCKFVKIDV